MLTLSVSCGGGSSGSSGPQTGVLLDSPVEGMTYNTESQSGTTNADGEFSFIAGETVVFSVGEMDLPPGAAKAVVTPSDLSESTNDSDAAVINIVRTLQSLDEDGNPDNGISIPDEASQVATEIEFDQSESAFENDPDVNNLISNSGSSTTSLISTDDALDHYAKIKQGDEDFDGVRDEDDNCPAFPNSEQVDTMGIGRGDVCAAAWRDGDPASRGIFSGNPEDTGLVYCSNYDFVGNCNTSGLTRKEGYTYHAAFFQDADCPWLGVGSTPEFLINVTIDSKTWGNYGFRYLRSREAAKMVDKLTYGFEGSCTVVEKKCTDGENCKDEEPETTPPENEDTESTTETGVDTYCVSRETQAGCFGDYFPNQTCESIGQTTIFESWTPGDIEEICSFSAETIANDLDSQQACSGQLGACVEESSNSNSFVEVLLNR